MPFKSRKQAAYLRINKPKVYRIYLAHTHNGQLKKRKTR